TIADTLSLHDALPIYQRVEEKEFLAGQRGHHLLAEMDGVAAGIEPEVASHEHAGVHLDPAQQGLYRGHELGLAGKLADESVHARSEEHTSELQSRENL